MILQYNFITNSDGNPYLIINGMQVIDLQRYLVYIDDTFLKITLHSINDSIKKHVIVLMFCDEISCINLIIEFIRNGIHLTNLDLLELGNKLYNLKKD